MSERATHSTEPTTPRSRGDAAIGASVFLSAAAVLLALRAVWLIDAAYERCRVRTDLDAPDWFAINMDLTFTKVLPLALLAVVCELAAGALFLEWAGRAGWVMRVGFVAQWLAAAAVVGLVATSRMP